MSFFRKRVFHSSAASYKRETKCLSQHNRMNSMKQYKTKNIVRLLLPHKTKETFRTTWYKYVAACKTLCLWNCWFRGKIVNSDFHRYLPINLYILSNIRVLLIQIDQSVNILQVRVHMVPARNQRGCRREWCSAMARATRSRVQDTRVHGTRIGSVLVARRTAKWPPTTVEAHTNDASTRTRFRNETTCACERASARVC